MTASTRSERPTKAQVRALQEELDAARQAAADLFARVQVAEFDRDLWRAERCDVPEAEALARCIRALDALTTPAPPPMASTSSRESIGFGFERADGAAIVGDLDDGPPSAMVSRILQLLASRYGVTAGLGFGARFS